MWRQFLRLLTGRSPADSTMTCPACGFSDTLRGFAGWEEDGERGLRGKLPSGHIVVACPECRTELAYDSLTGGIEPLRADRASEALPAQPRSPHSDTSAGLSDEQTARITHLLEYAVKETTRLWTETLGEVAPQPQHDILVWIVATMTVKDSRLSADDVIDLATTYQQSIGADPAFEAFLSEPDIREGLRELVRDARTAQTNRNLADMSEMLQSYLLMPLVRLAGDFGSVPVEHRGAALACAANIGSKTTIFSEIYPPPHK